MELILLLLVTVCHITSSDDFNTIFFLFFCTFSIIWGKKKKYLTRQNLVDAMSPEDGWFPLLLVDRDCVHTAGWIILPPQSRSWLDFLQSVVFFSFFFPQPFSSPLKKESYRGLTSSVNALDMLDDESSFSSQTQCIFSHPLKRWISDEATRPRIARSLPPESWTVSLFSPSVLWHDACTVAARKVWCIVGKVIHWLKGISEYTGGKMKHCCRCWCRQKTHRLCSWSSEMAVILWKKNKKLSAKLLFPLFVFFLHFFASFLFCLRRDWCNVKENLL